MEHVEAGVDVLQHVGSGGRADPYSPDLVQAIAAGTFVRWCRPWRTARGSVSRRPSISPKACRSEVKSLFPPVISAGGLQEWLQGLAEPRLFTGHRDGDGISEIPADEAVDCVSGAAVGHGHGHLARR